MHCAQQLILNGWKKCRPSENGTDSKSDGKDYSENEDQIAGAAKSASEKTGFGQSTQELDQGALGMSDPSQVNLHQCQRAIWTKKTTRVIRATKTIRIMRKQ